jgi:hypothetical protein
VGLESERGRKELNVGALKVPPVTNYSISQSLDLNQIILYFGVIVRSEIMCIKN